MDLPATFIANIHAAYPKTAKAWLEQLSSHIDYLSQKWNFHFLHPITNLSFSFVGLVKLEATHEQAVLKLTPEGSSITAEVHCLQCFTKGVPKIYAFDETKNAVLMEFLKPGTSLKTLVQMEQDELATRIICQRIRELQSEQQKIFTFKHLSDLAKDLSRLQGHLEKNILLKAQAMFKELTTDRSQDVILHGDLHHDNILSQNSTWKVIDPHGYIGDPAAEIGAMIRNPFDCFPKDRSVNVVIENRLKILSEELSFDTQRIKAWAFCITLLSAAWNVEDFSSLSKIEIEIALAIARAKI